MSPPPASPLFGREADLLAVEAALSRHRFVTITGAPGVGKSALARVVARRRGTLCPLSDVRDLAEATRVVARALGIDVTAKGDDARLAALIGRVLAHRTQPLLVLDGADRSGPELAERVGEWLRDAPGLRVLATSRVRLEGKSSGRGDTAEHRVALAALETPSARVRDVDAIAASPAVRLFVHHAERGRSGYRIGASNAAVVSSIVRTLEGVPLAIELCAARVATLSEREIADLLAEQLDLLEDERSGRSLRSALAFSWEDLSDVDRGTLAACACFRGSFTLDAVVAASSTNGSAKARVHAARSIERLIERSLLLMPSGTSNGGQRYTAPSSVRAYVLETIGPERERELRSRHARWVASRDSRGLPVDLLDLERESLEDALEHAIESSAFDVAALVALAFAPLALARGPLGPFIAAIGRIDAHGLEDAVRAELAHLSGVALLFSGRRDEAVAELERACSLADEAGAMRVRALATSKLALVLGMSGKSREAREKFDEARELNLAPRDRAVVLKDYANVLAEEGNNDEATAVLARARTMFHAAGDVREEGFVAMMLGMRLLDDGELGAARRDCGAALELLQRAGDRRSEAWTLAMLALVDSEGAKASSARERLDAALALVRALGDEHTEGILLSFVGNVALEHGPLADAETAYRDAAALLERAGDRGTGALVAACAAVLDRERGRPAAARAGFARAEELLAGDTREARAKAVAVLKSLDAAPPKKGERLAEEVRLAHRIVGAVEARFALSSKTGARMRVVIASDGSWVRLASGTTVRLLKSRALAAVVELLALERIRHAGRPVTPAALVRVAWPGERILLAAAKNRLHVTISRLRRLGLGSLIVHDPAGYLIDDRIDVRIADAGEQPG